MDDLAALAALAGCNTEPLYEHVDLHPYLAEVYRARGWAWGTTAATGRVWLP